MKNWKLFVIEIFVLLLAQVLDIQAGCSWESGNADSNCTIACTSTYSFAGQETTNEVLANLENKLRERAQCNDEGINLTLREGMVYPELTLKANWFTARVKVNELLMFFTPVSKVEEDAFNATAFTSLKKLILQNFKLDPIKKGIFNGLESLEILNLKGAASLKSIEKGVLDVLNQTLKEFTLEQSNQYVSSISIHGFTGSEQIEKLEYVKYLYKLGDTISNKSFVGLHNVKTLDLSECQITTIGPGSFDPISSSIEVLNLDKNLITKLPEGIFTLMLPSDALNIFLTGHKWYCDCDLMHFKLNLMEYPNYFFGTFKCDNSPNKGSDVINADFCDFYIPPSTTTTIATTSTTTVATTTTPPIMSSTPPTKPPTTRPTNTSTEGSTAPPTEASTAPPTETSTEPVDEFSQECFEQDETEASKTVAIKTPRSTLAIKEDSKGDIIVQVDSSRENSVLIWFSTNDRAAYLSTSLSSEINCLNAQQSISINNLKENTAYTFCLMDSKEKTVSPLDCISYKKQYDIREVPWLFDESKSLVISMVVVACSFSVFAGLAIGVIAVRTNEFFNIRSNRNLGRINNAGITEVLKETIESNSMMRQQSKKNTMFRDSYNTSRTTNTTVQYYLESNTAPPLPARPSSIYLNEEPIYATVP